MDKSTNGAGMIDAQRRTIPSDDAPSGEQKKSKRRQPKSLKKSGGPGKSKKGLPAPWPFPRHPLESALGIARALEDKFAGKPTPAADLAKALGFNQADDWRFQEPLRSAAQYGLVSGSGAKATVEMAPIGVDLVAPSDPTHRRDGTAIMEAP